MILRKNNEQERQSVIDEAKTWLKTPFHDHARVKGVGTDCLCYVLEVFERVHLAPHIDPGYYSPQWHLHRSEELYLNGILKYAKEIEFPPKKGDVVLMKFARTFSHGAIVISWPIVIHSWFNGGVQITDLSIDAAFIGKKMRFFSVWE